MSLLRSLRSRLPLLGLLYLVAVVFAVWGFAVARYEVFPYDAIRPVYVQLRAFVRGGEGEEKSLMERLTLHRQERPRQEQFAYSDVTGFRRIDESFTDTGFVLMSRFSSEHGQVIVELVRLRDFELLHRWVPPIEQILEEGEAEDTRDNSFDGYRAQHPILLEGGSVAFTSGEGPLVRIGRDSEIEWINTGHFHHTIERDHEGNLVVPNVIEGRSRNLPVPLRDDGYAVVAPDGRLLSERSIFDILMRNGYEGLLLGVGKYEKDRIHLNDAEPVHRALGTARVGDVILSPRNISTVFLYRPATDSVIWLKTGPWLNQHDVNLLPDGSYSVFGNDMIRFRDRFIAVGEISDVYVYDPVADTVARPYTAALTELNAVTQTAGRSRVLENGDVFVEVHDAAQLVRLGPDRVRWVYVNGQSEETVGMVHWARYYRGDEVDLSWLEGPR